VTDFPPKDGYVHLPWLPTLTPDHHDVNKKQFKPSMFEGDDMKRLKASKFEFVSNEDLGFSTFQRYLVGG